jgi:hypothetical protein
MNLPSAQAALDEAFTDSIKNLFLQLERNIVSQGKETALSEFTKGIDKAMEAYDEAGKIIKERFWPEGDRK